jgi:hypothetical protein
MLFDRIVLGEGKTVPSTMFLADTDTWLFEQAFSDAADASPLALRQLLNDMDKRKLDLIAAHGRFCRFSGKKTETPNFSQSLPEIYRMLDDAHGTNLNCLHGGSTLGKSLELLSLLSLICHRYPGSRNEDVHYTILSHAAGIPVGISNACYATNRVPPDHQTQLRRWFSASAALRKHYGNKAFKGINRSKDFLADAKARGISQPTIDEHLALIEFGKTHSDDLQGDAAW